jgi:aryl-alcohol dehydrogenase-like predicted oxidoreductase
MHSDESIQHLKTMSNEKPLSRRDFVRVITVASAAGPGLASAAFAGLSMTRSQRAEAAELIVDGLGKLPKVPYGTRHGGMKVSRICMSSDWNGELIGPAVDMGVNFVHKAGYWGNVPDAVKKLPRESYFTDITVDNTSPGNDPNNYDQAYHQVTDSLAKNGLQYYDVFRAHYGWHNLDSFNKGDNASYRAFKKLKSEGKVKYFGVSQHPYSNLDNGNPEKIEKYADLINAEIESGLVDSMQVWYSYGYPPEVKEVFAKASKAGIAMVAMKVYAHGNGKMRGDAAKMAEMKADGKVGRALLREVMSEKRPDGKPIFCTCVSALGNTEVFEDNMGGISPKVALHDGYTGHLA